MVVMMVVMMAVVLKLSTSQIFLIKRVRAH
jgi:hypothetical protein